MDLRRYFSPAEPNKTGQGEEGTAKEKETITKRKSSEKLDYEAKRKRSFLVSWTKEFLWLEHDKLNNIMFCRVCREFPSISDSTSSFVTGTSNFRKDPIRTHEKSLHHKKCIGVQSAASFPEQTPIAKNILKINQAQQEVLKKLFRTAYYVAKSELPLAKFSSLCQLQKANGLDLGSTYLNDHACREFIGAIAQTSRDQIEKEIQESRFLSILADGSTDTGIIEQELVHVRYVRDNGDISTHMIKCQPVKSANAAGILEAIDEAVNTMGIGEDTWKRK